MKNRLEDEYRQLMQSETPDLWDRIEAGIQNVEQEWPEGIEEKKKRNWGQYSLPIAACVAACICIPLALTGFFRTGKSQTPQSGNQTAADMAAPEENYMVTAEMADENADGEECAAADEGMDNAAAEPMEEQRADTGTAAFDAEEDSVYDLADDTAADKSSGSAEQESVRGELNDMEKEKEEMQKTETIRLHIWKISSTEKYTKENGDTGMIYQAETSEGGVCTIYVSSASDFSMESGKEYEITVIKGNEAYDYEYAGLAE